MSNASSDSHQQPDVIARVAVAVVLWNEYVLVGERAEGVPFGGLAEFPGGRVEADESWEDAARRETIEETGVSVDIGPLLAVVSTKHDNRMLEIRFFRRQTRVIGESAASSFSVDTASCPPCRLLSPCESAGHRANSPSRIVTHLHKPAGLVPSNVADDCLLLNEVVVQPVLSKCLAEASGRCFNICDFRE